MKDEKVTLIKVEVDGVTQSTGNVPVHNTLLAEH